MNCNNSPIKTQYLGELPIDMLESLPDYILAERVVEDPATGNDVHSIVRVPAAKLFPTVTMDNVFALEPNNTAIVIPENQVVPCYVSNEGAANIVKYADDSHHAIFMAIGKVNDLILAQNVGVVNIPEGHDYIVGAKYYLSSTPGEVTTDSTQTGQLLFVPVSNTKLALNIS